MIELNEMLRPNQQESLYNKYVNLVGHQQDKCRESRHPGQVTNKT